ncbi:hypothetical protein GGS26DRAFT_590853 [Hypomontagnella submonticulosa]|nr:hypothetical protein GGS26DRAFT_590853 [Hypomontagnella submonticulosa]
MQITKFTVALLTAVSGASAKCWSGGESGHFGSGLTGANSLSLVCSYLSGTYRANEQRHTCVKDNKGIRWDFTLKKLGDGARDIETKECESGFGKEAFGCEFGGHSSYANWEYKADPQNGECTSTT